MNKKGLEVIWAKAVCEVWQERFRNGECSSGEAVEGIRFAKTRQGVKNG